MKLNLLFVFLASFFVQDISAASVTEEQQPNAATVALPYSDHAIAEIIAEPQQGGTSVVLNICGRQGAANIFGNFGADGEPVINVSPVYRLPELIRFFNDPDVKQQLAAYIKSMQQVLQAIASVKQLSIADTIASLSPDELLSVNTEIGRVANSMRDKLIALGGAHGLEALGIGGWIVQMKPSKIFPAGILSPAFVYESPDAFHARFVRMDTTIFRSQPGVLMLQEVDRGGERAEVLFEQFTSMHQDYGWVAPVPFEATQLRQARDSNFWAMIGYKRDQFTEVPELRVTAAAIKQILNALFFKDDKSLDKTCVAALRDLRSNQIKFVVSLHGDYNMANKMPGRYEILRQLFDLVPGLELCADLNAQVGKTAEIQGQFAEFRGTFKLWPTPETGTGSNPTLDCLIRSPYGVLPTDINQRLDALLQEALRIRA